MRRTMLTPAEASALILSGRTLLVAGDEALLRELPRGRWIGGTIPYFMSEEGGLFSRQKVSVTELPEFMGSSIHLYAESELHRIPADAARHGVSFIIVPANSAAHLTFAQRAPEYPGLFATPLVGWNAGVALEDLGSRRPFVFDGLTLEASDSSAVVLHASLPPGKSAVLDIANPFTPGDGDEIRFESTGFSQRTALIGGARVGFAGYLKERRVDTRLPLVADYSGAMINTSFQRVDERTGTVHLYAPVFEGVGYKIARPVADYAAEIEKLLAGVRDEPLFSCNCILNYLYGGLEGRKTGTFTGPITFGEIAYQQLNQTLVHLSVRDA